ncbi:MAG: flavodoxin I [Oceanicoccus sp.]|jgi:flavodoxin I
MYPEATMKVIKIVYSSCGGNTELVCQKVAELVRAAGHEVSLHDAKLFGPEILEGEEVLVLASPTYGVGELERFMAKLLYKADKMDFTDRPCAVISLGDEKYHQDYFLESMKLLAVYLKKRGAKFVTGPLMIGKHPASHLETTVPQWTERFLQGLNK